MKFWRRPLDSEKISIPEGRITVIGERCKGCGICIEFCPREVLAFSKEINSKGYHVPEVQKGTRCLNCHYCEIVCPDFAIFSEEVHGQPEVLKK